MKTSCLHLSPLQKIGPFTFTNCTIGRISHGAANNGVMKTDKEMRQLGRPVVRNITISNGSIGINMGRTVMDIGPDINIVQTMENEPTAMGNEPTVMDKSKFHFTNCSIGEVNPQ